LVKKLEFLADNNIGSSWGMEVYIEESIHTVQIA